MHPYLTRALATDLIKDWQQEAGRAQQARLARQARSGRRAHRWYGNLFQRARAGRVAPAQPYAALAGPLAAQPGSAQPDRAERDIARPGAANAGAARAGAAQPGTAPQSTRRAA